MSPHAVHLHGYSFAVMATGFPDYNETTGKEQTQVNKFPETKFQKVTACAQTNWDKKCPVV